MLVICVPRIPTHMIPRCYDSIRELERSTTEEKVIAIHNEGTVLHQQRNALVKEALTYPEMEWVVFLDSDMEFHPETLNVMLRRAKANDIKILSAVAFTKDFSNPMPTVSKYLGIIDGVPTFAKMVDEVWKFLNKYQHTATGDSYAILDAPESECLREVDGSGAFCLLIHRSVLEKIGEPWFSFERGCSEDYYFALRAKEEGFQFYADLSVQCGHISLSPVSFRAFMFRYPEDEMRVRNSIGGTHYKTMMDYLGLTPVQFMEASRTALENISSKWEELGNSGIIETDTYMFQLLSENVSIDFVVLLREIFNIVKKPPPNGRVLVFGGGLGTESVYLARQGWNVDHYDVSDNLLRYAMYYTEKLGQRDKVNFTTSLHGTFDMIIASKVFDYIEDLPTVAADLVNNHLKSKGLLVVTFTSPGSRNPCLFNHTITWPQLAKALKLKKIGEFTYLKP